MSSTKHPELIKLNLFVIEMYESYICYPNFKDI